MSKSEMEIKYEEYLKSDDKFKIIDGKKYYKVIDCFVSDYFGILIVPYEAAPKANIWLEDENGFRFFSKGLVHMRFTDGVPEWYFRLATVGIDVVRPTKIGNYVRMCEE